MPRNGLAVCALSSCKNRRRECSPAPQKGRETPEGAVFCALRNLALPPEYLNRSVKCAAFDADLIPGTGTLPVWGRFGGGRSAPSDSHEEELADESLNHFFQFFADGGGLFQTGREFAVVALLEEGGVERNPGQERNSRFLGETCAAAGSEEVMPGSAVGADEA